MISNPAIDSLKHQIRELEDTIVHYKANEDMRINMLQRIQEILDETDNDDSEVI